jgi:putative NADPH-quinone reductase
LLPGWAYRHEGRALPTGLMAGKSARYVTTMDSPRPWYWFAQHDAFAGTLGRGTLSYVGFSPVKATLVFSARTLDARRRARWVSELEHLGRGDVAQGQLTSRTAKVDSKRC